MAVLGHVMVVALTDANGDPLRHAPEALADRLPPGGIDQLVITAASVTRGPFAAQPVAEVPAVFGAEPWGA